MKVLVALFGGSRAGCDGGLTNWWCGDWFYLGVVSCVCAFCCSLKQTTKFVNFSGILVLDLSVTSLSLFIGQKFKVSHCSLKIMVGKLSKTRFIEKIK